MPGAILPRGLTIVGLTIGLVGALTAAAEEPANNLKAVHEKLEAQKRAIVAQYMELTEAEGQRFWPVYEQYQTDLHKLEQRMHDLLESYAADYRTRSLTDEKAQKLLDTWIALDRDDSRQRGEFAPKVLKVLPPKKAARYLQIENEYRTVVRYDLAASVPLVE